MSSKGFVTLHRGIFDWEWFDDVYVFKLFVCLILLANHEDKTYKGVAVPRGSLITSIEALSKQTKLSINSVKHSLKKLLSTGEITEEVKPNKYRIITINNYDKFQLVGSSKPNSRTNSRTNKRTNSRTTNNKYNKNVSLTEKHSEKEKEKPLAPSALVERPGGGVTLTDVRQYQIDERIGTADLAVKFFHGFTDSGTRFPKDWKTVYKRCAAGTKDEQAEFFRILNAGGYRQKWGAVGD